MSGVFKLNFNWTQKLPYKSCFLTSSFLFSSFSLFFFLSSFGSPLQIFFYFILFYFILFILYCIVLYCIQLWLFVRTHCVYALSIILL
ncbi:hypothetical protein RNJ44_01794 [Nakaseomyces bracarensis]|uniref:Uncharacterized protein n=1 Tax=Nakaseomyces bracarensis TaxID=273131 RepID=A0ABR4NNT6_9SACH